MSTWKIRLPRRRHPLRRCQNRLVYNYHIFIVPLLSSQSYRYNCLIAFLAYSLWCLICRKEKTTIPWSSAKRLAQTPMLRRQLQMMRCLLQRNPPPTHPALRAVEYRCRLVPPPPYIFNTYTLSFYISSLIWWVVFFFFILFHVVFLSLFWG